jgi:hypothetical protein
MLTVVGGFQNLVLPMLTATGEILNGNVINASLRLPDLTVSATVLNGPILTADLTLPMLTVSADFGISAALQLPKLKVSGSILSGNVLRANISLPRLTATGSMVSDGILSAAISLPRLTLSANILAGGTMSVAVMLPRLALAATGYTGTVSTASISLPMLEVSGEIWGEYILQAAIELPMLTLSATFAERVATETTTFVMQAATVALTQYNNFNFNSAARFNGVDLVAGPTGIFALGGARDDAALIDATVRLGVTDFGTAKLKRVNMVYLGYRSDGSMRLRVIVDEQDAYDYAVETRDTNSIHGNRIPVGKGMRGTYWQTELGNVAGADFDLDYLQLMALPLSRKI